MKAGSKAQAKKDKKKSLNKKAVLRCEAMKMEVAQKEKRFELLYEKSADAIMTLEPPTWRFTSGNPAAIKMFDADTEKKFISLGPWQLSPKEQPDGQLSSIKSKKMIDKAMHQGSNFFEWTHKRYKGEDFPATVLLTRVEIGGKKILQATVRDISEQKKAEEKLRREKEFSSEAINSIPGTFFVTDEKIKFIRWNKREEDLFNLTSEQLAQGAALSVVHEEDKKLIIESMKKAFKTGKGQEAIRVLTKDGWRWHQLTGELIKVEGRPHLAVIGIDITEKKEAEQKLKENEEKYRTLVSNIPGVVYRTGSDWMPTFIFNSEKVFGYTSSDLIEKKNNWMNLIYPEDKEKVMAEVAELAKKKRTLIQEYRIMDNEKKVRWVRDHKTSFFIGGIFSGIDGVAFDITKRREEEKIKEDEEKYRSLFENSNDAILILSLRGQFIDMNETACNYLGYSRKELLAKKTGELSALPFFKIFFKQMKLATKEKTVAFELNHEKNDGSLTFFKANIKKIEYGKRQAIFGVVRDITREKELDLAKSEFLAIASHQLRTPLTSTKWILEMFKRDGGLNPKQAERLDGLNQSNERLIVLANRLLSVTRIETGRFKAYKKMTNIEDLTKESRELFTPAATAKKQQLKLEIKTRIQPTNIDPMFFTEAINNIINNAVNYAPEKAVITINVGSEGDFYLVSVHNKAPIIPKADQEKVWEKFHRGYISKNSTSVGSSGLGLFVAKAAVEANGGKIWLKSETGSGTTFFFTVPKK